MGNLLTKLYEPTAGQIFIDGQPLELLDDKWVRENVTLVQQSSVLFGDSLFSNVALGKPDPEKATKEEVLGACHAALLQSTIAGLPQGLDTLFGPQGFEMRGGQKQMVALARARLRNPTVLILDEITSSLDQASRALVMDAIREWRKDRTTVIITHDTSNIDDGEYVYVMENASVAREGFKRDLHGLSDGVFKAASASPVKRTAEFPTQVRAASSPHRESFASSLRTDAGALSPPSSRGLFGHVFDTIIQHPRPGSKMSLGANAAHVLKTKIQEMLERPSSSHRPTSYIEAEKRRFSAFINSKFFPLPEREPDDQKNWSINFEVGLEPDSSNTSRKNDAGFIFGTVERRANIPELRLKAAHGAMRALESVSPSSGSKTTEKSSLPSIMSTIWPALQRVDKLLLVLGLAVCLVGAASTPAFAYCLAQLMSIMWSSGDKAAEGRMWAFYLLVVAVTDGFCTGASHYLLEKVG